ncbi:MAG: hypothetical protein SOX71_00995 [Candidatus Faecousia sp.]|nr:hypothetical protein [Candidatus Faecousia sp.]
MNVIFMSPHFPLHFYQFCDRLKNLGVNVLGIGDTPYDAISQSCRDSLTEYYRVDSLEKYEQVYKAVAFYIYRFHSEKRCAREKIVEVISASTTDYQ